MYKAVIFDLDGTLVNSLYDLASSMNKALARPAGCLFTRRTPTGSLSETAGRCSWNAP